MKHERKGRDNPKTSRTETDRRRIGKTQADFIDKPSRRNHGRPRHADHDIQQGSGGMPPMQTDQAMKNNQGISSHHEIGEQTAPSDRAPSTTGDLSRYPGTDLDRRTFLAGIAATGASGILACSRNDRTAPINKGKRRKAEAKSRLPARAADMDETAPKPATRARTEQSGNELHGKTAEGAQGGRPERSTNRLVRRGLVLQATNHHALDGRGRVASRPVEEMLDWMIRELVGKSSVEDCWAALFSPGDVVGIKPNAFATRWNEPSPAVIDTIVARLHAVGIPYENIYLWDHWNFRRGPLYAHLRKSPIHVATQKQIGYDRKVHRLSTGGWVRFNKWVPRLTAIINVPVFKDHDLAGVTCSMKNLAMGSIINPASHHPNSCSPSVPQIYALPELGSKVRLIIADAFRVIYNNGPFGSKSRNYNARHDSLYMSLDPVAQDRIAWDVIDGLRKDKGLALLMDRGKGPKKVGRPIHVLYAAQIGLGEAELSKIRRTKRDLD